MGINEWVNGAEDPRAREFRQAVRTLFAAIARKSRLREEMIIKGGVLLAAKFDSSRFTMDVDFSTDRSYSAFDEGDFLAEMSEALASAAEDLDFGLDCRIQSHEVRPASEDKNFQTLKIKIGYAYKGTKKHKKLAAGSCPTVLKVDYSFNERNTHIDLLELGEGESLKAYSVADVVGEKFRAIIQQKTRNRNRRQDAYDIFWLLEKGFLAEENLKGKILSSLIEKTKARGLEARCDSLDDEETINRSKAYYDTLRQEIAGDLPDFEKCYGVVKKYYKSLPWNKTI